VKRDLVGKYAQALKSGSLQKGGANEAPHVRFARAETDEQLQNFIEHYGPICPIASSVQLRPARGDDRPATEIVACEELARLRRERNTFVATSELLKEVKSQAPSFNRMRELVDKIWIGTNGWFSEWKQEGSRRRELLIGGDQPSWAWSVRSQRQIELKRNYCRSRRVPEVLLHPDRVDSNSAATNEELLRLKEACDNPTDTAAKEIVEPCHEIVCTLLNGFPVYVQRWEGLSIEFPAEDVVFGIRPALYYLLRCDYLSDVHIARCPWQHCSLKWFRQDRRGQIFCSAECERKNRQRDYYLRKGRKTKCKYYVSTVKPERAKARNKEANTANHGRK
jgi:hypothetical protein